MGPGNRQAPAYTRRVRVRPGGVRRGRKESAHCRHGEEEGGGYLLTSWDPTTGQKTADVPLGPRRKGVENRRHYAASPDGTTVYTSHHDGDDRVSVFDAVTGKERFPLRGLPRRARVGRGV